MKTTTPTEDRVLSEVEAARFLTLSRQTLANMRCRRTGPRYIRLLPGRIGYLLSDLKQYVEERRITPEAREEVT